MFHHVIPVKCRVCYGIGCKNCNELGFTALDKAPYEGEYKCHNCKGYGYVVEDRLVSQDGHTYYDIRKCPDCEYSGRMDIQKLKSPEWICEKIINWEMEAGESFADYFDGQVNEVNFMFWALGKKYITPNNFELWEKDLYDPYSSAHSLNHILYNYYNDHVPYAMVESEDQEYNDEDNRKAYMILAEFISESSTYRKRFNDFFNQE